LELQFAGGDEGGGQPEDSSGGDKPVGVALHFAQAVCLISGGMPVLDAGFVDARVCGPRDRLFGVKGGASL
jgi:hypothetical protein